jgi:hypothetical protein
MIDSGWVVSLQPTRQQLASALGGKPDIGA